MSDQIKEYLKYRGHVFRWILQVVNDFNLSIVARDTSIKYLDAYFCTVHRDNVVEVTIPSIARAAVIAVSTAVLLLDPGHPIKSNGYDGYDQANFEQMQKSFLSCVVPLVATRYPSSAPSVIVSNFLHQQYTMDDKLRTSIFKVADAALVDFLLLDESIYYVEMTIAVCALIIAFSVLDIGCKDFIGNVVPDNFFNYGNGNTMEDNFERFNTCLEIFKSITISRQNSMKSNGTGTPGNNDDDSNQQIADRIRKNCALLNLLKYFNQSVPPDVLTMLIETLFHPELTQLLIGTSEFMQLLAEE